MRFLVCLFCFIGLGQTKVVPHVTDFGGNFSTTLQLQSASPFNETISMKGYRENGSLIGTLNITIRSGEQITWTPENLFSTDLSHIIFEGSESVNFTTIYLAETAGAAPAHVADKKPYEVWRLSPGDWSLTYDALAIVNTDNRSVSVEVRQYSENGNLIQRRTIDNFLPAKAKALYVLSGQFNILPEDYFEVSASGPISITALRGNNLSTVLWENPAKGIKDYEYLMAEELRGIWAFATSVATYQFTLAYLPEFRISNIYPVYGSDEFGNADVISYFDIDTAQFAIYDESSFGDSIFIFEYQNDLATGCFHLVYSDNSFSDCRTLAGAKVELTQKAKQHLDQPPIQHGNILQIHQKLKALNESR